MSAKSVLKAFETPSYNPTEQAVLLYVGSAMGSDNRLRFCPVDAETFTGFCPLGIQEAYFALVRRGSIIELESSIFGIIVTLDGLEDEE